MSHVQVVERYGRSGDLVQHVVIQIQTANRDKVTECSSSDVDYSVVGQVNVKQSRNLPESEGLDLFQMVVAEIQAAVNH